MCVIFYTLHTSVTRTALILQPLVAATGWRLKGVQRWLSAAGYVVGSSCFARGKGSSAHRQTTPAGFISLLLTHVVQNSPRT